MGCPQQPPIEKVPEIREKLISFLYPFHNMGRVFSIVHFGTMDDPAISISHFFDEMRLYRSLRVRRLYHTAPFRITHFNMRHSVSQSHNHGKKRSLLCHYIIQHEIFTVNNIHLTYTFSFESVLQLKFSGLEITFRVNFLS